MAATTMPDGHSEMPRDLAALAREHGLERISTRPALGTYLKELWRFRHFTRYMATSRAYAQNQNNYLGQAWAVLTPILNAAVYVVIFGLVLRADRGVENGVAFIVIGVFLFRFFDRSVVSGGKSLADRQQLVRSLHFPRAVLPIAAVITELASLIPALVAMSGIVLLSGRLEGFAPITIGPEWLLLPVVVLIFAVFNVGVALIAARIIAAAPDLLQIIQFALRFAMYGSGVIFPVTHYVEDFDIPALTLIVDYQPIAVMLNIGRQILMDEPNIPPDPLKWFIALGWALFFLVIGFLYFWRAEERYGRE